MKPEEAVGTLGKVLAISTIFLLVMSFIRASQTCIKDITRRALRSPSMAHLALPVGSHPGPSPGVGASMQVPTGRAFANMA